MIFDILFNNPLRIQISEFLSSEMFIVDYWTLVHLFFGIILMFLIIKFKLERKFYVDKFLILSFFLVSYEIVEFFLFITNNRFFLPETLSNQLFDILIGLIGGGIYYLIRNSFK